MATALAIPGLVGAGDPQIEIRFRPEVPFVLEAGGRRDALVTFDFDNRNDRAIRVDHLRVTYFDGDVAVKSVDPATAMLVAIGLESDPRIDAGSHATWPALCLAPPTAATDRVRFEFVLAERRGVRTVRATQSVDVPLRAPPAGTALRLPFSGAWRVEQGHTCETGHRRSPIGSEFAWDFAIVSDPTHGGAPPGGSFGQPVLAPIAGTVVTAVSDVADNETRTEYPRRSIAATLRDPLWYFGNYVILDGGGVYVLLAHLRRGSIVVKAGDTVREGDQLGLAGNSGNTRLPHLHVQVMDRPDPTDPSVSGLPARFRDYVEATTRGDGERRESIVRRVSSGDPPEGSVVFNAPPIGPPPSP